MISFKKMTIASIVAVGVGASLLTPMAAQASEAGDRNTTLALGALAAGLALNHQWAPAAIAGFGAAIADSNWQGDVNVRHDKDGYWYDRDGNRLDNIYDSGGHFDGRDNSYGRNDSYSRNNSYGRDNSRNQVSSNRGNTNRDSSSQNHTDRGHGH